jgi:hypothetical protein
MLHDFFNQSQAIKLALSAESAPRYVPVFMGHNDICTNTTSKIGNSCGGDDDPNNYCRTTLAAFEREFRRGMDQLIQIPSVRIGVSALVRVSELCNFARSRAAGSRRSAKFRVKGKKASLPPVIGNPPLATALVLTPPIATTGACGEAVLGCTFNGSGSSRRCE